MVKEFKEFISEGDLVSLAVAFVIGAAFVALINSLVANIFTPLIAAIFGQPDFGNLSFTLNGSKFMYGEFLNAVISFLSIAFVVFFFVVRPYNQFMEKTGKKKEEAGPDEVELLTQIRDQLAAQPR